MRKSDSVPARLATTAALLLTLALPVQAHQGETERERWNHRVEPYRIAGSVYYVGVEGISAFLITSPAGHILIDGGYEETAALILDNVRKLGFRPTDVKILLNTHAHGDHAGGLAALKAATGAKLLALAEERPALEAGRHDGEFNYEATRFTPVRIDRSLRDGEVIRLGALALTAHLTPGHSKGCTTFTLPLEEGGTRHTAIFYCSTTIGGNRLVGNRTYPEIVAAFRGSFSKLKRMEADIFLPNHPGMGDLGGKRARALRGEANPFIDPGELQRYVDKSIQDFEAGLARQRGMR